jgi:hypothetical protein
VVKMDVQREDIVSVIITLFLLGIWYLTLKLFNYPLISISILWTGMIVLSIVYFYIYKKKNRDMKLFKTRFLVSAIPIYPILGAYVYFLIIGEELPNEFRLLPFFVIITMLILNASVVYISSKK